MISTTQPTLHHIALGNASNKDIFVVKYGHCSCRKQVMISHQFETAFLMDPTEQVSIFLPQKMARFFSGNTFF